MIRQSAFRRPILTPRRGFTLVELLVVIVIIGVLIGLLVPAVGHVRQVAKATASKSVLATLETGLEAYKAESKLEGSYPPSFSDADSSIGTGGLDYPLVSNPYYRSGAGNLRQSISISGAGLLVWALAGADQLGTPGFKSFRPATNNPSGQWSFDSGVARDPADNPAGSEAYALYSANTLTANQPMHARFGPYVDLSRTQITPSVATGKFFVPAEEKTGGTPTTAAREYPMFLDGFGYPVLYWRAESTGRDAFAWQRADVNARSKYYFDDNRRLTGDPNDKNAGWADPANEPYLYLNKAVASRGANNPGHELAWDTSWTGSIITQWPPSPWPPSSSSTPPVAKSFQRYVLNMNVQARPEPQRADSYLLVSPGADGLYGTSDDITNFSPNAE